MTDHEGNTPLAICLKTRNLNQAAMIIKQKGVQYGYVVEEGVRFSYVQYALEKFPVAICFMLIEHGFPLDRALKDAGKYRELLVKKYGK